VINHLSSKGGPCPVKKKGLGGKESTPSRKKEALHVWEKGEKMEKRGLTKSASASRSSPVRDNPENLNTKGRWKKKRPKARTRGLNPSIDKGK